MYYDVAQVCLNGHVINADSKSAPAANKTYCDKCGSKSIIQCPDCASPIRGQAHYEGIFDFGTYELPSYCDSCGHPFPWTTAIQEAAFELIEFSELDNADKEDFKDSVNNLMQNTPNTSLAILKFKKYAGKAGMAVGMALKDILVDVVSEAVKKTVWPS
ncbi:DUF2321 domain-containing protein [Mucilaginibacter sp. BJC16-A38]|uniref:DUF2321 domain-containing protein n=1 Tax=Mucilaginibacter phenanthrenivorans TaxID=1234842 RepID=UPI002157E107|nr:DUF2321 domain-containing protein [Mucilaginibacter phenanthrenivorans]MCR8561607.1 DUF2321 domain-containing protein [Mucilaginibacter phenanthrenivorans]